MFYCFVQNNSGGRFISDHRWGISQYVIVEGIDCEDIIERARSIGLYFNGCKDGRDCPCCGDRWITPWEEELVSVPEIYGENVSDGRYDEAEGYIHYLDGTVTPIKLNKD
jgi:hypothetical protein